MGGTGDSVPGMAMLGLQFIYAGLALLTRAVLLQGMSPRVFVIYRHAIATMVIAPLAYFSRRKVPNRPSMGLRSFALIFLASFIGVTINQNFYFEGLFLASSSAASAMANLVPAVTFLIAAVVGIEKVRIRSLRSIAKVAGTVLCVCGAVSMALLRGPNLLNTEILPGKSVLGGEVNTWLPGCLFLFGSSCCWSIWLILQVPVARSYPDSLSFTAWMCFFATLQSAVLTLFLERDKDAWRIHSNLELACCIYAGIAGSGFTFFVQSWCISKRGPLFSAMFNPVCTIIVTLIATLFLHEEVYTGSLVGALAVITGLYVVLWGKAKDLEENQEERDHPKPNDQISTGAVQVFIDETSQKIDLEEPLLSGKSTEVHESQMNK